MKYQTAILLGLLAFSSSTRAGTDVDFDFGWRFHLGDLRGADQADFNDQDWRPVTVPHDYSIEQDFSRTNASCTAFLPGGIGWYRNGFVTPADTDRLGIEFDGVSRSSKVWVNGHLLGGHAYAFTPFYFDLTPWLKPAGQSNVIAVRVDRARIDDCRWYPGSGIIRRVWLVKNHSQHVSRHGIYVTTPEISAATASFVAQVIVTNESASTIIPRLNCRIVSPSGSIVWQQQVPPVSSGLVFNVLGAVPNPQLWSPENPALYRFVVQVLKNDQVCDEAETTFGIRSILYDAQKGFFLNGKPLKLHGVCVHQDAGGLGGAAVLQPVWERRLKILREMGVNAIRCSHNPAPAFFYDLCDRLGMLVLDEAFDEWNGAKRKCIDGWNVGEPSHGAEYSEFFDQCATADLREMILRSRNHPCVIMWSIGNEIDYPGDPFSYPTDEHYNPDKPSAEILVRSGRMLASEARKLDPTRPVTAALANLRTSNATGLAELLDVVGYNYQYDQYAPDMEKYPARKLFGSENGYGANYADLTAENPRVFGQFLWVGIDYLGEAKRWPLRGWDDGLLDTCGFLKPRAAAREALWAEQPMVYLCVASGRSAPGARSWQGDFGWRPLEAHWNWQGDKRAELPVIAYSNCKQVELFLNGQSLGLGRRSAEEPAFHWRVPFAPGQLRAVALAADGRSVETELQTAGAPVALRLTPDRMVLKANGEDAVDVYIEAVDNKGNRVPTADPPVTVAVNGAGTLAGLDNGDQGDMTRLTEPWRKLHHGRALALVRSGQQPGAISITVTAPSLSPATLSLTNE